MRKNITTMTDSYKLCHWAMYPENTETVYSYFEARNGAKFNKTVFFGLQYFLKEYFVGKVVTREKIEQGAERCKNHLGDEKLFNRPMWEYILEAHDGHLPLHIKSIPEGTPVDIANVLMTIWNTDKKCAALTNHTETILSEIWGASTVATLSFEVKKLLKHYYEQTCDNDTGINFGLHDFGFRGVACPEAAAILGAGHLLNFLGTDTVVALDLAEDYYAANPSTLGFSVPATEHSIMTSLGRAGEIKLLGHLLNKYPNGILSIVIDSYDYKNFMNTIVPMFKQEILNRNGKVVFRPDSGEPNSTTLDVITSLSKTFGTRKNNKGFLELNSKVGTIWGDGIDYDGIRGILYTLRNNGWAANNIVFGMGGGLLQKINRDTQRFAFKSSAQCRNGEWFDIFKDPIDSSKQSKMGILKLTEEDKKYFTKRTSNDALITPEQDDLLVSRFYNGHMKKEYNFNDCRENTGNW